MSATASSSTRIRTPIHSSSAAASATNGTAGCASTPPPNIAPGPRSMRAAIYDYRLTRPRRCLSRLYEILGVPRQRLMSISAPGIVSRRCRRRHRRRLQSIGRFRRYGNSARTGRRLRTKQRRLESRLGAARRRRLRREQEPQGRSLLSLSQSTARSPTPSTASAAAIPTPTNSATLIRTTSCSGCAGPAAKWTPPRYVDTPPLHSKG